MLVLALAAAAGCGAADDEVLPGDDDAPGGPDAAAPGAPDAAAPVAACEGLGAPTMPSGTWTLEHAGATRSFNVHVPASYDPAVPTPLVFDFHGLTMTAAQEDLLTGMRAAGDAHGFIVVQPQGLDNSWNAGACCGMSGETQVDDVGFVLAMLDRLGDELCVDPRRVYALGMSNGGFFSHRLGCELADRFAAVASVAGVLAFAGCAPSRPMPVLQLHGTADTIVPYMGSQDGFPSVPAMMGGWAARDGCAPSSTPLLVVDDVSCEAWPGCDGGAEVILCTVDGGGHTWPGGPTIPGLGKTTQALDATAYAWEFFSRHSL